jgi:hypothetical protein
MIFLHSISSTAREFFLYLLSLRYSVKIIQGVKIGRSLFIVTRCKYTGARGSVVG